MAIRPYLFFDGRAEEAAEFYRKVLGAEVSFLMRFSDSPDPVPEGMVPPGAENKIMHMALKIGGSEVLVSDGGCRNEARFQGFSLTYGVRSEDEATRVFEALCEGGQV